MMRLVIAKGNESIGHISEPVLTTKLKKIIDNSDAVQLINSYINAKGYSDSLFFKNNLGGGRIVYAHNKALPKISIIIIDDGDVSVLQRCVMGVLEKSKYTNYEILILSCFGENKENRYWLEEVSTVDPKRIKVTIFPHMESRARLHNIAAERASGDYLLLLDTTVFPAHDEWLENLVNHGLRDEVGCVGSKIINVNEKIYSAGMVLGLNGVADNVFVGNHYSASSYMHRLEIEQNYNGLLSLCLLIRRTIYQEVGGFDALLPEGYLADIDLSLKVRKAGYLSVWTPFSIVATTLSPERKNPSKESYSEQELFIFHKWKNVIAHDPAYNKNLSLTKDYIIEQHIRPRELSIGSHHQPRLMAFTSSNSPLSIYRLEEPLHSLRDNGLVDGAVISHSAAVSDFLQIEPDVIITQSHKQSENIVNIKSFKACFSICDMNYYDSRKFEEGKNRKEHLTKIQEELAVFDRVIFGSELLAEQYSKVHRDIHVLPTYLPSIWNDLTLTPRSDAKPRVGCVTLDLSEEDIELVANIVRDFSHQVTWVFLGVYPPKLKPFIHEYHRYKGITSYPQQLTSLNLDFAIAPLVDNHSNRYRGNILLLEFGICGVPIICSDVVCYKRKLPILAVKNRYKDWSSAMNQYIDNIDSTRMVGDMLKREIQKNWMLNKTNLEAIKKIWLPD
ncbi:glycosyltransferase family 2 protein [Symbiopectobacterium purcellii]|uniref:Glycosyltransferase n=1 Tax=Symbiopectobacterium purcellii TaxID=2871826 RepID=A0ABX9AGR0_9ENTR|nr:glycosyltransferase [Symbiopectobacterium purcellii]QZN94298.1 glycosyltransferase [Symbiopectobacterium purcellii]